MTRAPPPRLTTPRGHRRQPSHRPRHEHPSGGRGHGGFGMIVAFPIALALGAPFGAAAWGGATPGPLPANPRIASAVAGAVSALAAVIVPSRAGLQVVALPAGSPGGTWTLRRRPHRRHGLERRVRQPLGALRMGPLHPRPRMALPSSWRECPPPPRRASAKLPTTPAACLHGTAHEPTVSRRATTEVYLSL
jgi:hypothetical protein